MGDQSVKDDFKLQNVSLGFGKCFEGENIRMDRFIDAYRELIRWGSGDIGLLGGGATHVSRAACPIRMKLLYDRQCGKR